MNEIQNNHLKEKSEQNKNYVTALIFLKSAIIGIGFLILPSMAMTSGVILSIFLLIISKLASLYGSFLLNNGKLKILKLTKKRIK